MSLLGNTIALAERLPLPDSLSAAAIDWLVSRTKESLSQAPVDATSAFAKSMRDLPVAVSTVLANRQHYELPTEFFKLVLGPRLKYSCCLFTDPNMSLLAAEDLALAETARNAALNDGQRVLDLGCGWGSLSIWMAKRFPRSSILSVSNSHSQHDHLERLKRTDGLSNLTVLTADMNSFATDQRFDRIVSVEMFEHMSNWHELLRRMQNWLAPNGRVFLHVFTHKSCPYRFDHRDDRDWIGQHFFTGGIMPSHNLLRACCEKFEVEAEWRWSGENYQRTAQAWLANFDARSDQVSPILARVYGPQAAVWHRRWRLFFLATARLFGFNSGNDWGVSHYRLAQS